MGILIGFMILTVMPVELFESIRPGLFTSHMNLWQKAFHDPMPWGEIWNSIAVLGTYIVTASVGAWAIFVRRDILS
jgi:ABC-type transport system involved in multi-copper enzyme maturation permease subunit